ncbi:MZA anti-phage system associated PD-(D/E)XK motif protein MzaD [Herbaspirillum sp. SJZ107]|uniref:MZA anti-phage system associated PD-(D/E)XK motif protein MzaD n=1 Tax=Herbaspirillum sp. SJZ107 TaxID=2572881 RepID=UPI001171529E|nr:MZA anti-phage system associated PD-(D/E)XK motif protein MzaD [Herbaspirillum sp. SJZ107]TQK03423.1 putative PD-(D/E)XK family protein DUF4420 [Herbaspirillum sp. SJZ107]
MPTPLNEELAGAWRALSGGTHSESGWRSIAVSGLDGSRLQAARKFPENREALLIGFESATLPPAPNLPSATGFRVERIAPGLPGDWLALVRQEEGGIELFARMASDVVAMIAASAAATHQRQLQLFLGRVRAWQQFMSRSMTGLSPEAELGLAGELVCLDMLIDAGVDAHAAVEGWKGPLDGLQDFEIGSSAIEVKSTLSHDGFPATILSLEQLDDSTRQPLFILGCRFAVAAEGLTLSERVHALRLVLESDPAASGRFENALLQAGYVDAHAEHYTRRLVVSESRFVLVDETFPRLVTGNVPAAIRRVRYELDLDATGARAFSLGNVLELTGAV